MTAKQEQEKQVELNQEAAVAEEVEQKEETLDEIKEGGPISKEEELKKQLEEKENRIAELETQVKEQTTKALRAQADFDNFQRRMKQEQQTQMKYRSQSLISDLLPVLDNFERALATEVKEEESPLLKGVEMVYDQLLEALKTEGVEVIEAVGKPFDPHFHQAVMQVQEDGIDANTVVEEFQKGYKLKDRVIRPSMVKVNM